MFEGSRRRFGITSNISGLSHGIVVNSISLGDSNESAQARDEKGKVIDIAVFGENNQVSIEGLYVGQGVEAGTVIKIDDVNYLVTSTSQNESNTAFQTASVNARYFPGEGPGPGPGPQPPGPIIPNPSLTFKAINGPAVVQLNQFGSPDAISLQYKINNSSWGTYSIGDSISLDEGDIISFSGVNDHFSKDFGNFYYFSMAGDIEASENIQSLMNFSTSATEWCYFNLFYDCSSLKKAPDLSATTLASGCYYCMFQNCTSLTALPQLPATTLARGCYSNMYQGCTGLSTIPDYYLPAETLTMNCYQQMFKDCTSLTAIPQSLLIASTLTGWCYYGMFEGCTSLSVQPLLNATTLAECCYQGMFKGCTSLHQAPELGAQTLVDGCYQQMFSGCSNLDWIRVSFTDWGTDNTQYTYNWVDGVAEQGDFYKPSTLLSTFGPSNIPVNWYVTDQQYDPPEPPVPPPTGDPSDPTIPLTFKFTGVGGGSIALYQYGSPNAISLQYSKNGGAWTNYTIGDSISIYDPGTIAFSGANNYFNKDDSNYYSFTMVGNVEASGNIQSLMNWSDSCTDYCYCKLFTHSWLKKAPDLPATGLAPYCYAWMFDYCLQLTAAPHNLPATTLAQGCYYCMFLYCDSLTSTPALPATTLTNYCYQGMFKGCSSLVTPPSLPATGLAKECYMHMFYDCSSLTSINVAFTEWGSYLNDTSNWVNNVAPTGIFYKPAALSTEFGVSRIPSGWTVINKDEPDPSNIPLTFKGLDSTNAVQLTQVGSPSAIVLDYSKNGGAWTTYNINDVIELNQGDTVAFSGANDHFSKDAYSWYNFAMTGIIEVSGNIQSLMNWSNSCTNWCYKGLFDSVGNHLINAPYLPATTLADHCYDSMFKGCTSLTAAPQLLVTTLAPNCYQGMFAECTNLSSAPILSSINLAEGCYSNMFHNCTSLTAAPQLPATTLADGCYYFMFLGCINLTSIEVNFTDWNGFTNSTTYWVWDVAPTGTFYKPSALSTEFGVNRIPSGWTVIDKT